MIHNGHCYSLEIGQQPVRARMCGLGDKDPRHVSPPPCIKLVVTENGGNGGSHGNPVDITKLDTRSLVLVTELWSVDMTQNLSHISVAGVQQHLNPSGSAQNTTPAMSVMTASTGTPMAVMAPESDQGWWSGGDSATMGPAVAGDGYGPSSSDSDPMTSNMSLPLHNLRGTLVATPNIVRGLDNELGIWFILHHLNIRAEGRYRLKFSVTDLGNDVNTVMASMFSAPLTVYSAKKFPGVYPYTELSQCFIKQGLRISIRTGLKRRRSKRDSTVATASTDAIDSTDATATPPAPLSSLLDLGLSQSTPDFYLPPGFSLGPPTGPIPPPLLNGDYIQ
ncbi:hypothetical protein NADFUDRAFT_51645 [Nadsonia fulvescens var. elongata DSM 6958]|uniref:Velvet domain-containing protein n=1 Tax=Nadsonia fulvescens var. elongata DSM 6958 TaxID=857566 RepID=A0A1E3PHZ2_9ASCO|nr:hypothetical protein NADFUDRAFT_51645 [Nadsonia fulvescens var. elongata DSM 6958]